MHRTRRNGRLLLTPKERAFISAYLDGANSALSAAAKAGYRWPGKVASQLLHKPLIAAEIERRQAARRQREEFNAAKLMDKLVFIVQMDPTSIIEPSTWKVLEPKDWPVQELRSLVKSFEMKYALPPIWQGT